MATYQIAGHPLNYGDAGLDSTDADVVRHNPVGTTVTLTLTGPKDTKVKGHGVLK
jgi:hypothetical protein